MTSLFFPFASGKKSGFTLIELLVVISIIAILSSIILAALSGARSSAEYAAAQESLLQMRSTYELQATTYGNYNSVMPIGIFATSSSLITGTGYSCNTNPANYSNYCFIYSAAGCSIYGTTNPAYSICTNLLIESGSSGSFYFGVVGGASITVTSNDYALAITNPSNPSSLFCLRSSGGNVTTTSGYLTCLSKANW